MSNYYTIDPLKPTDYASSQPNSSVSQNIQINAGITSNWKYRQYMQKNANQIMKYNTMETMSSGNNPYVIVNTTQTNKTPHLYHSIHDNNGPTHEYTYSDLKQSYTTKEQMNARMIAPTIPTTF